MTDDQEIQKDLDDSQINADQINVESMTIEQLIEALGTEREANNAQLESTQRAQAELANYKKRSEEQRIAEIQFLNASLLAKLLPVSDEFEIAIQSIDSSVSESQWIQGIKLIHKKLEGFLASEGVSKIECEGEFFDPLQHEALSTEETDKYESGVVTKVLRNGYKLRDRVIQPAQVVVAKPISK